MQVLYGRLTCTFYSNLNMLLMKKIERVNIMCNDSKTNSKCNCIAEILKVINILQSEVCPGDTCLKHVQEHTLVQTQALILTQGQ